MNNNTLSPGGSGLKRELNKSMFNVILEAAQQRISRKLREVCGGNTGMYIERAKPAELD